MYCPACGAANTEGAKFCGACGARIGDAARAATADPARAATLPPEQASPPGATTPSASLPARASRPPPPRLDPSMGSLAPPRGGNGRAIKIGLVLLIDVGLVVGGVVLATRSRPAATEAVATGSGAVTGSNSGSGSVTGSGSGSGSVTGSGSVPGSGAVTGSGSVTGSGPGTGSRPVQSTVDAGTGAAPGSPIDARSLDWSMDPIDAAAAVPAVDAAGPTVEPIPEDAADPGPGPDLTDAAEVDPLPAIDAGDQDPEVGADAIARQFNQFVSTNGSKLDRCYQSATKALPDDQPIRGEVDIELGVMPTGQTENVRATANTTGSDGLARCVVGMIQGWTFSRHDGTGAIALVRKFGFGPQRFAPPQ